MREFARALCFLYINSREVHQAHVFFAAQFPARVEIVLVHTLRRLGKRAAAEFHFVKLRQECRMAAMVRPIGVEHL